MSNAAKLGSKIDLWMMDRANLIVIGHDTDDGPEHELYRHDVRDPVDPALTASIRKHGVMQPIRARRCKADPSKAEVIMGRSRCKGVDDITDVAIKIPVMLWPAGATVAEIIGAANAENHIRKTESVIATADHAFAQLRAEGGAEAKGAINSVAVDLGITPARVRSLLKLREAADVVAALKSGAIKGEAALALATLPDEQRAVELAAAIEGKATLVEVRDNVVKARAKATGKTTAPRKATADTMEVERDAARNVVKDIAHDTETMRVKLCTALGVEHATLADAVTAAVDALGAARAYIESEAG